MFKKILSFFKVLNKNVRPAEIAHAVSCGLILGFMPKDNLLWYILFIFFLFIRMNRGCFLFLTLVFSLLAPFLDPVFDLFGYWILTLDFMTKPFAWFLNIPLMNFTKLNNTIVCGSLASAIILYIPVFFLTKLIIKVWRMTLAPKIKKTKLVKFMSALPLVKKIGEWYE